MLTSRCRDHKVPVAVVAWQRAAIVPASAMPLSIGDHAGAAVLALGRTAVLHVHPVVGSLQSQHVRIQI
ncbi:MAG TPA: hypothetical protein VMF30_08430 [Pirellulales bacterium]|nr:hypothetical protein [Pirellulales bacterium]